MDRETLVGLLAARRLRGRSSFSRLPGAGTKWSPLVQARSRCVARRPCSGAA